ncbi:hypothetical protein CV093_17665 [Oceanobacillus sp. 143]|uniref:DUF4878 domain-containing protein n=1 Tax=Oceanobacillus zhaokaii TaxID=2052660 RepID=A0A345PK98_9BACI|nr:hypothetical protein [Oceanobacillus zhaokaii]AXI10428.1 hypothetical protein CUC15_16470 [Oceanobacillus zhaokaii]QGS69450.1 hypothetical protein CV093_17665 [Oceanobacillus sp. 143]
MKKRFTALFLFILLFLSGCMGGGAAGAVEGMYKAAINGNGEQIDQIFSQADEYDSYYLDDLIDELASNVMDQDGIDNMKIKEIKRNMLNKAAVEDLDNEFDSNWNLVGVQLDKDYLYVWVLKEVSGNYFIVYGEDFDQEEFEEMLK